MTGIKRITSRIKAASQRLVPAGRPAGFEPEFYGAFYPDLASLTSEALVQHYVNHGKQEGRFASEADFYGTRTLEHGPLPDDFNPEQYRAIHPDLRRDLANTWQASDHYFRIGRPQDRPYSQFDPDLYKALYFSETVITDYELRLHFESEGKRAGLIASWYQFISSKGARYGAWVEALKVDEFALLNRAWAGDVSGKLEAIELILSQGARQLAPISFDLQFDPVYYREANPDYVSLDDATLYERWLFVDMEAGTPGSATSHLHNLRLTVSDYPKAFDWKGFARNHPLVRNNPWSALEAFLGTASTEGLTWVADDAEFLTALGDRFRTNDDALAIVSYERARRLEKVGYPATHELADAYFRSGFGRRAMRLFQEAAQFPEAGVWTFVNGARSATRCGAFQAAVNLLEAAKPSYGGETCWRDAVRETIEAAFQARVAKARKLYANPLGRERADRHISRAVERTKNLWERLDPMGGAFPASPDGRVVMLANFDIQVCVHYRINQKRELFERLGRPFEVFGLHQLNDFLSALAGASAAFFFRIPAWPSVVRAITVAKALGVPTYYEIDDLIFDANEYPDTLESYGGLITSDTYQSLLFGVPLFRAAIQMCDYGISSTAPLSRALRPLVQAQSVFWLPNGLDSHNEQYLASPPQRVRRNDAIVIAYASGTTAHNSDFHEQAAPALLSLLKSRPNARLLLVGFLNIGSSFDEVRSQIMRFDYVNGSMAFWSLLADADINLAILKSTWATDSKSEIKWLEAAVMGIPSIVSETAMYRDVLQDGTDVLIVRTPEEWEAALTRMVDDKDLRRTIGQAARDKASRRYSLAANSARLQDLLAPADHRRILQATAISLPITQRKTRILLANVWFPPQTIGGATRVLRDNLDAWLESEVSKEFEFAVVCTDHDVAQPDLIRVDDYRGVTIIRISTPLARNMDWQPENPQIELIFADILRDWKPDLVHFHAIQRLTASVVKATQAAEIPYVVTPHDAWWLSDWHFLVDDTGGVHQPCEDMPRDLPSGITVSEALDRRRLLRNCLSGAEAILAVSDSFAEIYKQCGYAQTTSIPNGVSPIERADRAPSITGRVRLVHVGNMSKHKGYHLVRAALTTGNLSNVELTIIDHARPGGSVEHAKWGSTPVRIIGRLPQSQIHELYAQSDVLLAPSIWPESFGLVTREAAAAGLWVIAGDLGAVGENVIDGVNGFVVSVSTPDGLLGALKAIDTRPEMYQISPPPVSTTRKASDQARDVASVYRKILTRPLRASSEQDEKGGQFANAPRH